MDGSLFHMAANRGEEKATGLGASNDWSWRSYPAHSLEDRGVEEIFVGGEGEPEFIGVRLGPFELSSALTHEGRDGPCWETFLGSDMGRKDI